MTLYAADEDGACVCIDCIYGGCITGGRWCEAEHCHCECRNRPIAGDTEADRARELDDRPPAALQNIARDLEAEAKPSVEELMVERFGRPRRARRA